MYDDYFWLKLLVPAALAAGLVLGIIRQNDVKLPGRVASATRLGLTICLSGLFILIIVLRINPDISHDFVFNLSLWLVFPCVFVGLVLITYGKTLMLIEADENDPDENGPL